MSIICLECGQEIGATPRSPDREWVKGAPTEPGYYWVACFAGKIQGVDGYYPDRYLVSIEKFFMATNYPEQSRRLTYCYSGNSCKWDFSSIHYYIPISMVDAPPLRLS